MTTSPSEPGARRNRPVFAVLFGCTCIVVGAYWSYTRDFDFGGGKGRAYHVTGVPALELGLLTALFGVLFCISPFSSRFRKLMLWAWLTYAALFLAFGLQHYGTRL